MTTRRGHNGQRGTTAASIGLLLIGGALLTGCAQAEKTRYVRHLTATVQPGGATSQHVVDAYRSQLANLPDNAMATADQD